MRLSPANGATRPTAPPEPPLTSRSRPPCAARPKSFPPSRRFRYGILPRPREGPSYRRQHRRLHPMTNPRSIANVTRPDPLRRIANLYRAACDKVLSAPRFFLRPPTISVVIPTKDAGQGFRDLLAMLRSQERFSSPEIVVVDSGSKDNTIGIAREFDAKVIEIPAAEFSHSHARNLGARHASGDYLLFTVQDALPPSRAWLRRMFMPLLRHGVVAVSCAEDPRPDADLFYRAISWYHTKFMDVERHDRLMNHPAGEDPQTLRKNAQLSDTACLIPKAVFSKYQYRGDYAEDLDLGLRLLRDGYQLAFLGSTRIVHSHNRPAYYHLRRGYVDNVALLRILPGYPATFIEPETLLRDVIFTWACVNSAERQLQVSALPCRPAELSRVVSEALRAARVQTCPSVIDEQHHAYLDGRTQSFLKDVSDEIGVVTEHQSILIDAVESFVGLMCEYMSGIYRMIDHRLVEEFWAALYKGWALQCGAHLGACFALGDGEAKAKLTRINGELTCGI